MSSLKLLLYQSCNDFIDDRIATIKDVIGTMQNSANDETKSSVGDKYETGRAMVQLEIEKLSLQLAEVRKLKTVLSHINPNLQSGVIKLGSVIQTDCGNFFLSISAGILNVQNEKYFALSTVSPLGALFIGKKAGQSIQINGKTYAIRYVE